MKTLGQAIVESRKSKGIRAIEIAEHLGVSATTMSTIENDTLRDGVNPETVVKIADFLNDRSILTTYLELNPVYRSIIPKIFPDLNNIRRDPAIIFTRFAAEARESAEAASILAEIFSNAEPSRTPNFCEVLKAKLEQVVDVQRCAEILFLQLIVAGVIDDADRCDIHVRQQQKCVDHGHHKMEVAA